MFIYILFFSLSWSAYLFLKVKKKCTINNNLYIFICAIFLFLISALRHKTVGNDTASYIDYFNDISLTDWKSFDSKEIGYAYFTKLLTLFSSSSIVFLAGNAIIFISAICWLIHKYSDKSYLSFLILISLGFFFFSMAGLRQTLAMSILIFSIKYVQERKLLPFLLLLLLAFFFHNTSIIFIIVYFIARVEIDWKYYLVFFVFLILAFFFQEEIKTLMFISVAWERLAEFETRDSSLSLSGFFIQLGIATYCMTYYKRCLKRDSNNIIFYNLMFLGLLFQLFTPIVGEFFRVSMYFSIFDVILISNVLMSEENKKIRLFEYIGIQVLLFVYFIFSNQGDLISKYKFLWET